MQFSAVFIDTWRLLRARQLFWVTFGITLIVGVLYASFGFNDRGYSIFFVLDIPDATVRAGTPAAAAASLDAFYQITRWWTTFFGVMLGLVTCASIFPDLMMAGAIDLVLSKPIGRGRLFFYKFISGLLIAGAQIAVLAVMVFASIRWRHGFWHAPVFWSVPLAMLLFSYLYSIVVFFGVWTRSTLAALVLTLVAWLGIGGVQWVEGLAAQLSRTTSAASAVGIPDGIRHKAEVARKVFSGLMIVLPKTGETTDLVRRSVMRPEDKPMLRDELIQRQVIRAEQLRSLVGRPADSSVTVRDQVVADIDAMAALEKSPGFIIGTSLVFEIAILLLAGWSFSRRDY